MIGGRFGPWVMRYKTSGTGVMLSVGPTGWALSGAVAGRGVVGGWMFTKGTTWRNRKFVIGRRHR